MPQTSAGILPFRRGRGTLEVLLVHPGGPFYTKKDLGFWSVAKGLIEQGEDPLDTALREIAEETGFRPSGEFIPLQPLRQPAGKIVRAWAVESDWNPSELQSNTFTIEWPPKSGRFRAFPEVDRAEWFAMVEAERKILPGQIGFLEQLRQQLDQRDSPSDG